MKMYKKPITEITDVATDLMQLTVTMSSAGGNGPGGGTGNEAPRRRGDVID